MVDQRAIYSLKFTSEVSHSRVRAYITRLTSQDIPQMERLLTGQTDELTLAPIPTSLPVYQLVATL